MESSDDIRRAIGQQGMELMDALDDNLIELVGTTYEAIDKLADHLLDNDVKPNVVVGIVLGVAMKRFVLEEGEGRPE